MLTLMLEGAIMLGLNVHVNSALILLGEGTVRALEVAILCADIVERHCGCGPNGRKKIQFFGVGKNDRYR